MFNRSKILLLSTLTLCIVAFAIGCDQPEDVITPNGKAYLTLSPERLPDNPTGTIYQLWVANDTDTLSLGKFGFNYMSRHFLSENGEIRADAGRFFLDESIENYNSIIVSVEPINDPLPNSPASILLLDLTSSPTIKLVFPQVNSLWDATVRYNLKSTSDGQDTTNDGSSIWFCSYKRDTTTITDTFSVTDWKLDSGLFIPADSTLIDTNVIGIDSIIQIDTIFVLGADESGSGLDTLDVTTVRYKTYLSIDTSGYYPTTLKMTFDTSSYTVIEDKFTQDDFQLPNLQEFGWKYRGWVVSDVIDTAAVGKMTLPGWLILEPILMNYTGGLLSTGIFYEITQQDEANPFVDNLYKNPPRVPLFPGEDFLMNLPAPMTTPPVLANSKGHVFISLEPEFYNETTNFPLLAFVGDLPVFLPGDTTVNGYSRTGTQQYTLTGYMYSNDDYRGFPSILVTVENF